MTADMKTMTWTDEMIDVLTETFPVESTQYTADILGVSVTTVKNKARELGIVKFKKTKWLERADYIRKHFNEKSLSAIAVELGITLSSVRRIAASIGLKRTEEERFTLISKTRTDIINRERRRMVFGFDPITRIKVVTNRPRVILRAKLKAKGYVVAMERNVMYYPSDLKRSHEQESNGIRLGLRFMPLPVPSQNLLTTAI